ncbi:cobaltochelatase subunit CobN [Treponema putidum]|uniref:cobaltochelatase subunit CobN n=1 Tax=Treponema putidum TaxID=221027 RepID=UPI001199FA78|nr:cobaltochelatase subunit CobN [Treponema putidum]TWI78200.1 cobaltochelatase CobN [Treponema putidum]
MNLTGIFYGDTRAFEFQSAVKQVKDSENMNLNIFCFDVIKVNSDKSIFQQMCSKLKISDAIIMHFHGSSAHLQNLETVIRIIKGKKIFFDCSIPEEISSIMSYSSIKPKEYIKLHSYFKAGGSDQIAEFIKLFSNITTGTNYILEPLKKRKTIGIYKNGNLLNEDEEKLLSDIAASGKNIIGIVAHYPFLLNQNMRHVDAVIEELKKQGAECICIIGRLGPQDNDGVLQAMEKYFYFNGKLIIDAIILTTGYTISSYYQNEFKNFIHSCFENFNLPVFQAITSYLSKEEFEKSPSGLDIASISLNIYQPEIDGQIITIPIAASEEIEKNGIVGRVFVPMPERVKALCELVHRFAQLKNKKPQERRIAIILHNYPPRNDLIGSAHGLDTPNSLWNILQFLKEENYSLDFNFSNGQEIIDELIRRGTNEWKWTSPETIWKFKADSISSKKYEDWYKNLPEFNRTDLKQKWGNPPGLSMLMDDHIVIPGIIDGNIYIGLQPARSPEDAIIETYHDTHNPPPHSYLAFYKWVDNIFKADAIIHVGTHGTLEWLPGKEIALSKESYPDINIYSIPHFYIYNLGILGEGMQARRRSHAAILSHLIPSFAESDTYDYLQELEDMLEKYEHAKQSAPSQQNNVTESIFKLANEHSILKDLKIKYEDAIKYPEQNLILIHNWIHKIKNSIVRDGLHIYGKTPEKKRLLQLVKGLSVISQDDTEGLEDAIIISLGYSPKEIRKNLSDTEKNNFNDYKILEQSKKTADKLISELNEVKFNEAAIDKLPFFQNNKSNNYELKQSLKFICREIYPRLIKTDNEKTSLIKGLNGEFILPSLGGNPSRGNIKLLPTGRNFYSINPEEIPSKTAYETGKKLGSLQIAAYYKEHKTYPKNIAIIVYSTNTMKTYGEDIGEIFFLMGVRPLYIKNTQTVCGVEAISLEELGRPRIDVTMRISGLFRDSFPNLIFLMDEAVNSVAFLDEDDEMNPIKKNIQETIKKFVDEGIPADKARDRASVRVFSAPSGTYGAGLANLIESKKWQNFEDLAEAYITWSSHAYSKKFHGEKDTRAFENLLSKTDMAIKNEVSREIDLLDCDDFYNYHGGLIAAVTSKSGKKPYVSVGNTADINIPETMTLDQETSRVMRSRILNPKWLEGLKEHGYKGAQEISKVMDNLFGWDAAADNVEDWMYEDFAKTFLFDKNTLNWIKSVNKNAAYQIVERLLEANQRKMWNAKSESLEKLKSIFLNMEAELESYGE